MMEPDGSPPPGAAPGTLSGSERTGSLGPLRDEVAAAMGAIRASPQAVEPRMALFHLACLTGDWPRARAQLTTLVGLDAEFAMLARVYTRLIDAETTRTRVFAGEEQPVALGKPAAWVAMLAQALGLDGVGEMMRASDLRARAHDTASSRAGTLEGQAFMWIVDADPRLGPVLEVVVGGQYRWLPFDGLRGLRADPPRAARDLVWQAVTVRLSNNSDLAAFVPVRYPGSEVHDDTIRLAKETRWVGVGGEQRGIGQRLLATDLGDHAFLDIRELDFEERAPADA